MSTFRDIAVVLDGSPAGENVCRHAAALAKRHQAHLIGIWGLARDHHPSADFARGTSGIDNAIEQRRNADARKVAAAEQRFAELVEPHGIRFEFRVVWHDRLHDDAVLRALHCDLIVSTHPRPDNVPPGWSAERLLLTTGMPVLVVPSAWSGQRIGESVMIAWNRSREARRAVADAMPFMATAGRVKILVVDGDTDPDNFGESPGVNLRDHLSRHGATADIVRVSSGGGSVAQAISEQADEHRADLLVIGAYSRPRTTEILFGGTTRALLAAAPLPLLISR